MTIIGVLYCYDNISNFIKLTTKYKHFAGLYRGPGRTFLLYTTNNFNIIEIEDKLKTPKDSRIILELIKTIIILHSLRGIRDRGVER